MTETSIPKGNTASAAPRVLSPKDQTLFEHWRKTISSISLFSPADDPAKRTNAKETSNTISERGDSRNPPFDAQQHKTCIDTVNRLVDKSPIVVFMNNHLKKIGCDTPLYCAPCLGKVRGGFDPQSGIVVCEDTNPTTRRLEATLVHEMVHAFDRCRFKVDYNNIKHAACTEIRAVALSRECRFLDELWYHLQAKWHGVEQEFQFNRRMQQCVKRRATNAVMMSPSRPSREAAEQAVNSVFDSCFRDTRPFDELY